MKQAKQKYFRILAITMTLYAIALITLTLLGNSASAAINLRPIIAILPALPFVIIFPAMVRFLTHPDVNNKG